MKTPRILNAESIEIEERAAPPLERIKPHKWLSEEDLREYSTQERNGFELYVSRIAEEKMRNHSIRYAGEQKEAMGLLLGWVYKENGRIYSLVKDIVTTDLESTFVNVRFDRGAFEKLFQALEDAGFNYIVTGWYHSHPGHGCFMSSTDLYTQRTYFGDRAHSAIVIDPMNREIKAFYLEGKRIKNRIFAIYWDEYENPYYGTCVRKKVIKSNPNRVSPTE